MCRPDEWSAKILTFDVFFICMTANASIDDVDGIMRLNTMSPIPVTMIHLSALARRIEEKMKSSVDTAMAM